MSVLTVKAAKERASQLLSQANIDNEDFEIKCMLEQVKKIRLNLLSEDITLTTDEAEHFFELVKRRARGEPLQYILGCWEFYSLPFWVGKGVLIPRADTEILVDTVLEAIIDLRCPDIIDLCAGSGAIAVAIAKTRPDAAVDALEFSKEALQYLKQNTVLNQTEQINIIHGDLFEYNPKKAYDCIVSNPPYVRTDVINTLQKEMHFEPSMALDGGKDGLRFYQEIIGRWKHCLKPGGIIAVEIGYDQKDAVRDIFSDNQLIDIREIKDYNGNYRVITGTVNALHRTNKKV